MQADANAKAPVVTGDGIEMVYQVNHLSHFLLTRLLLPAMSVKPSRVVHVSSSLHYVGNLDREAYSSSSLNVKTSRLGVLSYFDTKLMNVIFSNGFQRRIAGDPQYSQLTSVSVHPGLVVSDLDRESELAPYFKRLREMIARPTIDGAIAQVTVATLPEIIQLGGGLYFEDHCIMNHCTESILSFLLPVYVKGGLTPHNAALNVTEQDWLWNTSSDILGLPKDRLGVQA
jgi:NAD(P)-dependent dehydrogenase (short-subunit alcohol dehydrogenase family)